MKTYLKPKTKYNYKKETYIKGITLNQVYKLLDYKAKGLYNGFIPRTYKEYKAILKTIKQ